MTLEAEFINRFEQFGSVTYDLLLKSGNEIKHRFNVKLLVENDTEEGRAALVAERTSYVDRINLRKLVNDRYDKMIATSVAAHENLIIEIEKQRLELLDIIYGGQ